MDKFYVEIVRYKDEKVVKRMGPMGERRAEKVEEGAGINLNWNDYFTRTVPAKPKKKAAKKAK
jgi:hypothetical protein